MDKLEDFQPFLAEVAKVPGWYLARGEAIRTEACNAVRATCCPLVATAAAQRGCESARFMETFEAARLLGLTRQQAEEIITAADGTFPSPLRQALLAACKL